MTQLTNIREALKLETMERNEETQKAIAESETALRNHSTARRWDYIEPAWCESLTPKEKNAITDLSDFADWEKPAEVRED